MRSRPGSRSHQSRYVWPGGSGSRASGSPGCGPAVASRNAAASRTVRARGPSTDSRVESRSTGPREIRPRDGLEPDQPAHAGRDADRPAAVAALREGHEAAGHRRRGTAAGPAGQPRRVPGGARRRPDVGLGVAGQPEFGRRRLAHADRAGAAQQRDHGVVVVGHEVGEGRRAELARHPGDHVQVLDRGRHPEQRRERGRVVGRGHRRFGRPGLLARGLRGHRHERPDLLVQPGDALERVLDELDRAHLAAADRGGRRQRRQLVQFAHPASLAERVAHGPVSGQTAGATSAAPVGRPRYGSQDGSRTAQPMTTATVGRRLHRGPGQVPAHLGEQAVALAVVAAGARGDDVGPDVLAAAGAGADVIDGVGAPVAVDAGVGVAVEDRAPGERHLAPVRDPDEAGEPDHGGHGDGQPFGVHHALAGLDDDGLLGQDEHDGATQWHDAQRFVRRVEHQRSAHRAPPFCYQ